MKRLKRIAKFILNKINVFLLKNKKVLFIYLILKLIKNRKNNEFINKIKNIDNDYSQVNLIYNNNAKTNDIISLIEVGNRNEGFFAMLRWILDYLYYCDKYNLKPVIKISDNNLYKDTDYNNINTYEYYFEQPLKYSLEDLSNYKTIIKLGIQNRLLAESLNNNRGYDYSNKYIKEMGKIFAKYVRFNDTIKNKERKATKNIVSNDKVLGVHIRGTDRRINYKNHPKFVNEKDYYEVIDKLLDEKKYSKIFLATDDQIIFDNFINRYGEDLVLYNKDFLKSTTNDGIHTQQNSRKYHNYKLGEEVIIDMMCLASCSGFISELSQVGLITRIYKESKREKFDVDIRLNKGICNNKRQFINKN